VGLLRLFLALAVVASHAGTDVFWISMPGSDVAVNMFFVISGFYMAMILNEKYTAPFPVDFFKNRFLRLMPVYWAGALLGVIVAAPALVRTFTEVDGAGRFIMISQLFLPISQDLGNVFCIPTLAGGCADPLSLSANPPDWSLVVEAAFYIAAPLIVRSVKRTFAYIGIGLVYFAILRFVGNPPQGVDFLNSTWDGALDYFFWGSSFLFFGLGALAYHLSKEITPARLALTIAVVVGTALINGRQPFWQLAIFVVAVPMLFSLTRRSRLDRTVGELSYPVYLLHWPVVQVLKSLDIPGPSFVSLGTWAALITIALAAGLHFSLDRWIGVYRGRIRAHAEDAGPEAPPSTVVTVTHRTLVGLYIVVPIVFVAIVAVLQRLG
jgi:peptidoglycan/LPS O-acetylase OafA/YrhL